MEPLELPDGTKVMPLDQETFKAVSEEIEKVLDKHNARYLPVIERVDSIVESRQTAKLFLVKKQAVTDKPNNDNAEETTTK
jgi:hypothetical protein